MTEKRHELAYLLVGILKEPTALEVHCGFFFVDTN
jgi:hypothetical protein